MAGLSVIVLRGADTLLHSGYGQAHVGLDVPATRNTRYRLVGPTYSFVAALVMKEVEAGRLSLDQGVSPLLPDFPWQGRSVTVPSFWTAPRDSQIITIWATPTSETGRCRRPGTR